MPWSSTSTPARAVARRSRTWWRSAPPLVRAVGVPTALTRGGADRHHVRERRATALAGVDVELHGIAIDLAQASIGEAGELGVIGAGRLIRRDHRETMTRDSSGWRQER